MRSFKLREMERTQEEDRKKKQKSKGELTEEEKRRQNTLAQKGII